MTLVNGEVDVPALLALSDSREEIVPKITSYRLKCYAN